VPAFGTRKILRPGCDLRESRKSDKKNLNYIVIGPWNHGGWGRGKGDSLGAIPFGSDTSLYFRQKVEAPWFAYWLKDKGALPLKEALVFQSGSNTWTAFDSWPPRAAQTQHLYFTKTANSISKRRRLNQRMPSTATSAIQRIRFPFAIAH